MVALKSDSEERKMWLVRIPQDDEDGETAFSQNQSEEESKAEMI